MRPTTSALLSADRLLNVACAMLRDGTCFDRHRVLSIR